MNPSDLRHLPCAQGMLPDATWPQAASEPTLSAGEPWTQTRAGRSRPSCQRTDLSLTPVLANSDWELRLRHRSAGRARLQLPVLRREPNLAGRLSAALAADPLIRDLRLNAGCASLVIHHEMDDCSDAALIARFSSRIEPLSVSWRATQVQDVLVTQVQDVLVRKESSAMIGAVTAATDRHRKPAAQAPIAAQARGSRRPGLSWALADVPIRRPGLARASLATPPPKQPLAAQPRRSSQGPSCWLCALYRRLMRWMVRLSLRCWWQGR